MATVTYTTEVDVDIDLEDFDADDLASALEDKGFIVVEEKHLERDLLEGHGYTVVPTFELETVVAALRQGRKEEGLILLERAIPELKGLLV